jgi:hypothetical protein
MGLLISLLLFSGLLTESANKQEGCLTNEQWIAAMVLVPLLFMGGLAEIAYFDWPYIFQPLVALTESK